MRIRVERHRDSGRAVPPLEAIPRSAGAPRRAAWRAGHARTFVPTLALLFGFGMLAILIPANYSGGTFVATTIEHGDQVTSVYTISFDLDGVPISEKRMAVFPGSGEASESERIALPRGTPVLAFEPSAHPVQGQSTHPIALNARGQECRVIVFRGPDRLVASDCLSPAGRGP
jgi:hypothetical protein